MASCFSFAKCFCFCYLLKVFKCQFMIELKRSHFLLLTDSFSIWVWISNFQTLRSYNLRRPQNFAKFSPYFWLALHGTKVRWRFRKYLWPSQNTWLLLGLVFTHWHEEGTHFVDNFLELYCVSISLYKDKDSKNSSTKKFLGFLVLEKIADYNSCYMKHY